MVLESTIICVDNSDYMRNGDFVPSRIQAQQDAVGMVCHAKTRSNPENNCALITSANGQVLSTLTSDAGRILSKLHQVQPGGETNFITTIRVAHLTLKHRQSKNHKMRIVVFVGSPIQCDSKDIVKLAKRLKKEKVNVDVVNFGEDCANTELLSDFVNTLNGKDGSGSHLITVPTGPHLSDALISSPILQGEDGGGIGGGVGGAAGAGGGFEFGVDPNEDPELAMALRVSMDEQRALQQQQQQQQQEEEVASASVEQSTAPAAASDDNMLEQALAMSVGQSDSATVATAQSASMPDFASMTEEQQMAYAVRMSMADQEPAGVTPMDTDSGRDDKESGSGGGSDYLDVVADPAFLQSVLENLPGVDSGSEELRRAIGYNAASKDNNNKDNDNNNSKDDSGK